MSVYFYMFCSLFHCQLLGTFFNVYIKYFCVCLRLIFPLSTHFLIGRYSSIKVLSVFMNALYEASGLDSLYTSSQFVHFNFILSFAKFF